MSHRLAEAESGTFATGEEEATGGQAGSAKSAVPPVLPSN